MLVFMTVLDVLMVLFRSQVVPSRDVLEQALATPPGPRPVPNLG